MGNHEEKLHPDRALWKGTYVEGSTFQASKCTTNDHRIGFLPKMTFIPQANEGGVGHF